MKQTGKEEVCNQYYLLPTAVSSSLPLSGVFFVIQLRALYTAKQQGRGFYCYFFHWCPRWFGLKRFFYICWHLLLCILPFWLLYEQESRAKWCTSFLMLCQTKALYTWTWDDINLKFLKTANGIFLGEGFESVFLCGLGKSKLWNPRSSDIQSNLRLMKLKVAALR